MGKLHDIAVFIRRWVAIFPPKAEAAAPKPRDTGLTLYED